jgi:hypothetical protein
MYYYPQSQADSIRTRALRFRVLRCIPSQVCQCFGSPTHGGSLSDSDAVCIMMPGAPGAAGNCQPEPESESATGSEEPKLDLVEGQARFRQGLPHGTAQETSPRVEESKGPGCCDCSLARGK